MICRFEPALCLHLQNVLIVLSSKPKLSSRYCFFSFFSNIFTALVLQFFRLTFLSGLVFGSLCCFLGCEPPTESVAPSPQLSPLAPLPPTAHYPEALLQNYAYNRGQLIFTPQNIRLGSPTSVLAERRFARTNRGIQVHLCLNHQQHSLANDNIINYPIKDGTHQLYAFLVSSHFESIKTPTAVFAKAITVQNGQLTRSSSLTTAAVVYNTPFGTHKVQAEDSLLVDFVLVNTTLSPDGNRVQLQLNEHPPWVVDQWQAYSLTGLQPGQQRLRLTLLDHTGQALAAPVEGVFEVATTEPPQ